MKLHANLELFQDAIVATSQLLGIREIYIEKDYWVTFALHTLFHSDMADQIVFKGGTALSKCYKLIQRFSEDLDITILQSGDESGNQLRNKIKAVSSIIAEVIPELQIQIKI